MRACRQIDRLSAGCHNWQIPSLYSPIKFSPGSAKNCFVNFQRAEGPSRFVQASFEKQTREKRRKKKKSMAAGRQGKRTMSSCDAELTRVRSARTFLAMPAHYSSLPLTGNYAEWELSLSKWASIVPTIHTVMLPYPANNASPKRR